MRKQDISEKIERILDGKSIIIESLEEIVGNKLKESGILYAIIGGHAIAIHGRARLTHDIDLMVKPADMPKVIKILNGKEAVELQSPRPDRPIDGVSFKSGETHIDLIWINQPWANKALQTAIKTNYGMVIDKPYLVLSKLWASRGEQDDTDTISIIRAMDENQIAITKKLVSAYFKQDIEDFDQMVEIAKI